jgi:hypothetical protein
MWLAELSNLLGVHVSYENTHASVQSLSLYSYTKEVVWPIILPWFDLRHLQNIDLSSSFYKCWRKGDILYIKNAR